MPESTAAAGEGPSLLLRHLRSLVGQAVTFDRPHDDPGGLLIEADEHHALLEGASGDVELVALAGVRKVGSGLSVTSAYQRKRRLLAEHRDRIEAAQGANEERALLHAVEQAEVTQAAGGKGGGGRDGNGSHRHGALGELLAEISARGGR